MKIRLGLQLNMVNVSQGSGKFRHTLGTKKAACAAFSHYLHITAEHFYPQSDFSVSHLSTLKVLRCLCLLAF